MLSNWISHHFSALLGLVSSIKQLPYNTVRMIKTLNFFESSFTDAASLRQQRIYTRIYLFLFFGSLSTLVSYSSIVDRTITQSYMLPSIADYEHLLDLYPDSVQCPCTRISIPYDAFVTQLQVTSFHQACTTNVVNSVFNGGEFYVDGSPPPPPDDLILWKGPFIDGLQTLCQLAENSVANSIEVFRASSMLAYQVISRSQFTNEMNATISRMQTAVPVAFTRTLNLIRMNIQSNALMSLIALNWKIVALNTDPDTNGSFLAVPQSRNNTDQNTSCSCVTQRTIVFNASTMAEPRIPQFIPANECLILGCSIIETLLLSSLSCFYSMPCIKQLRQTILGLSMDIEEWANITGSTVQFNSLSTRFSINDN